MKLTSFKKILGWTLLFLIPFVLNAADVQDLDVSVDDQGDKVEYRVTLIHTGAATDNVYSQAIDTYGLDLSKASVQFISVAGATNRDVDLFIEGSNVAKDTLFESYQTRTEWADFSPDAGGLEQTFLLDRDFIKGATASGWSALEYSQGNLAVHALADTSSDSDIIYTEKDLALKCRYIRFKSDGTNSNPATSSTLVVLLVPKLPFDKFINKRWRDVSSTVKDVD